MGDQIQDLSDQDLEAELKFIAQRERHALAKLLVCLGEFERRKLFAKRGFANTFAYALRALKLDEGGAYRRIHAARSVRRWPELAQRIERGDLHLGAVLVLEPILNEKNHKELFALACGKSRRELEAIVASRQPTPSQEDRFRRHAVAGGGWSVAVAAAPVPEANGNGARPWEWQAVVPVAMDRVRIGFDAAVAVLSLIDRARQILRHKYPSGRLEDLIREALELLLERKDPQRRLDLKPDKASSTSSGLGIRESRLERKFRPGRYVPAWVKRRVWERDGGRCTWRDGQGVLCGSKDWIEFDHLVPFSKGGRSDSPRNIRLLCRLHNVQAAEAVGLSVFGSKSDDSNADLSAGGQA